MKYYKGKPLLFTNPHDEMVYEAGQIAVLDELRSKVEALSYLHRRTDDTYWILRDDVFALIDGDSQPPATLESEVGGSDE